MGPWVIFDADNTLWETESLYDDARRSLTEALAQRGIDRAISAEIQQTIDEELYKSHGYSAGRFPESFDRTLTYFFPAASDPERAQIRGLAERIFKLPAIAHSALSKVITKLEASYNLGILTAGEEWVQLGRLEQFAYRHHFRAAEVVPRKDAAAFEEFIRKHNVPRGASWIVGDSLRSDIIPGHEAGLNAILVRSPNWHRIEMAQATLPAYVHQVADLAEILSIIPAAVSSASD